MKKKVVTEITLIFFAISMLTLAFNNQTAEASGTIYIRADGSIDPLTANVTTFDNITYAFTGNINESIVIERDNIVVDGAGYTLQGTGSGTGIQLSGRSNVTVKNAKIKAFEYGIYLYSSSGTRIGGNNITNNYIEGVYLRSSSNNSIAGNNITNNDVEGIALEYSSNNTISGNNITNNNYGIILSSSSNNIISGNNITANNEDGIKFYGSLYNNIIGNNITANNFCGIWLFGRWEPCNNNTVSGNNITNNDSGIRLSFSSNNTVSGNNMTNNIGGIDLDSSLNNTISGNNITNNNYGIALGGSANNDISGNSLIGNSRGIYIQSIFQGPSSSNNRISMNNVTNNEFGIWLDSVSNNTILKNSFTYNERGVYLLDSWNNSLLKNNITDNNYGTVGIHIVESSNNNISRNVLSSNLRRFKGIELDDSSNNSLCENEIANNTYGIYLYISSNNSFFHNDFKNNTNQVYDDSWQNPSVLQSINVWDDGYPSGGNYWSDYSGTDANNDGIGDSPYVIDANNTDNYPLINPWSSPSIAVENLTSSKTVVGQGYDLTLNVTVKNLGNKIEGFNVVVYSNSTEIHTRYVLLKGNQSSLITLIWNTTGFSKGNYTISAYAWPVLGETDTDDNRFTGGVVTVTIAGDLDGNFAVQLNDLVTLAKAYGSKPGEPNWNPNADLDNNGVVGLPDLVALAKNYGKTDP